MVSNESINDDSKNFETTIGKKFSPQVANWKDFSKILEDVEENKKIEYLKQFLVILDKFQFRDGFYSESYRKFAYIMRNLKFLATINFLQVTN